ncbi:MAG: cytidine/deoxycytidylate deaminase family protein [Clostridia bacterium]|nr:cytidine/deoxycytidylate deaminase family protein [Clostridia bacterium]
MKIWDKRFMEMAMLVGTWSDCIRPERKIGAVVANGENLLGVGYNKVPGNMKSCIERGECIRKKNNIESGTHQEFCYTICAEQNAIKQALMNQSDLNGATIYVSHTPCAICARWIISTGIKRVVYHSPYTDSFSLQLLKEAGVKLEKF